MPAMAACSIDANRCFLAFSGVKRSRATNNRIPKALWDIERICIPDRFKRDPSTKSSESRGGLSSTETWHKVELKRASVSLLC
mmetsp:Transcript_35095/g.87422  ORF Transcript_35095/g.87422 Transcript_35095/m.87422 type:complete len:83 (+) Transcript_35095:359-607(+)|eukprot:CAMPEP_0195586762 /NCGR_PEP_ID=MMETSP0814-20130614/29862_1 /TAXON_ID=97485 /ORGANISM="Prymnesium parvum, Strain Texoma1" /LENGTH=82 /DNA_ID=CAMNT_0040725369 /DNA_START=33 /DNA_END=281 /DNA_ORIENTATION=+